MIDRKLTGEPPKTILPRGTIDTQMHMYVPGYPAVDGGPGLPPAPLPTPDMYRQTMEWLGIDRVVITQGNAHQADNACLLACVAEMGDLARGVAVISKDTSEAEMEHLTATGIVGARIMDLPGGAVGLEQLEAVDAKAADAGWMTAVQFDGHRFARSGAASEGAEIPLGSGPSRQDFRRCHARSCGHNQAPDRHGQCLV